MVKSSIIFNIVPWIFDFKADFFRKKSSAKQKTTSSAQTVRRAENFLSVEFEEDKIADPKHPTDSNYLYWLPSKKISKFKFKS